MRASCIRLLSKRSRTQFVRPKKVVQESPSEDSQANLKEELVKEESKELLLFYGDRQIQARMMGMAAGVQTILGVAWTDSLWLVKNKLAEEERLQQIRDGFTEVTSQWYDFMAWYDWALASAIWLAPALLLLATRYSTSRWVHSLTLLPGQRSRVVNYSMFGFQRSRTMPNSLIFRMKAGRRCQIDGKYFLFHEKGTFLEPDVMERVYKRLD